MHITSLPGPHGCGDLGPAARHFVDWLSAAGQSLWQVLPLSPAGPGHSPYQSVSAFAGNPLMVDLDDLVRQGWLPWTPRQGFDHHRCDFERVAPWRMACLRKAWNGFAERASDMCRTDLADFCAEQAHWLDDYALFMVLDERYGGPWSRWPEPLARRQATAEGGGNCCPPAWHRRPGRLRAAGSRWPEYPSGARHQHRENRPAGMKKD